MEHRRIIKQGAVVISTHEDGSIDPSGSFSQGVFVSDTRFLSRFQIYLDNTSPRLLGSSEEELHQAGYLHTNPDLPGLPTRSIGVLQRTIIEEGVVIITLNLRNWTTQPVQVELSIDIDADFFDSFETRGVIRKERGHTFEPRATKTTIELGYMGLDDTRRSTHIETAPAMSRYENGRMYFPVALEPNSHHTVSLTLTCRTDDAEEASLLYAPESSGAVLPEWFDWRTQITISDAIVNRILHRSIEDLGMLMIEFPDLWVPAAGLPRFAVPFGRDSLFTSMETLIWNPNLTRNVLSFLARVQGKEENPYTYEQPGKILHEMHTGELARLKEIPFGLFYGSVDSTVLFLMVAAEYITWTADLQLYRDLKPNLAAAWKWIDNYGTIDGSGYVQYQAHTAPKMASAALTVGLFNQGWKDSANAVSYSDGTLCQDHPVALAEVQGYLYRALVLWGTLYQTMPESEGMQEEGAKLLARAAALKEQFNRDFWMPEKRYYAMALDGHHRQVDTITSNPGHCLWTGLIHQEHAAAVAATLVSKPMSSSWGIRTMASTEKQYNPLSYHNGSIWPFENTIIGAGLKSYGFHQEADSVFDAIVDASAYFEYRRWPEVYCGVAKELVDVLALQPDASRPQLWSAGAIFLWIQSWLGITPRAFSNHLDICPALPPCIERISVQDLAIAGGHLSLTVSRSSSGSVQLQIDDNPDDLEMTVHPTAVHHRVPRGTAEPELAGAAQR